MIRNYIIAILAVAVLALGAIVYFYHSQQHEDSVEVSQGTIHNVEMMAQLCAMDIYREYPVIDTVDNKVLVAIMKQRGSISFDMEKMKVDADGDTVRIVLPPEIVELREATDKNSWQIIDTKAIGPLALLRSDKMTLKEENILKARIKRKSVSELYRNGTVARARREGAENLQYLMTTIYRKPVVVTDPTPNGTRR